MAFQHLAAFSLSAFLLAMPGAAPSAAADLPKDDPLANSERLPLAQYLSSAHHAQSFSIDDLYKPESIQTKDADGRFNAKFGLLSNGPATLHLGNDVSTFAAFPNGLAYGQRDGSLTVVGDRSCQEMDTPVEGAPRLLAWQPDSRSLIVLGNAPDKASLYDVDVCKLARVVTLPAEVTATAVSPSGRHYAAGDLDGRIWAGSDAGNLHEQGHLAGGVLGLGFGPNGGLLFAVSPQGKVNVLDARDYELKEQFQLKWPALKTPRLKAVRFDGRYLVATSDHDIPLAWDLVEKKPVPFSRKLAQFFLENGTLKYRTWHPMLHLRIFNGAPTFTVERSPATDTMRVRDLDGLKRCYGGHSGQPSACPATTDWQPVETNAKGNFCVDDRCYVLTDKAFQWDHDQLLCRYVPGVGHFLWWVYVDRPGEFSPLPNHLPERKGILADEAVIWGPVAPPRDVP